jgi:predicted helicase
MTADLRRIKTFPQLIKYLRTELGWPVDEEQADDLTFDYSPEELGLDAKSAVKVRSAKQLRPLVSGQPWGIFWIDFEPKKLPVTVMRRILNQLAAKKRGGTSAQAAWNPDDLLFISAVGSEKSDQREIAFAHFHQEQGDLPTLRVLGWDGADTRLKMDYVAKTLKEKLRWPPNPQDARTWRETWAQAFRHKPGHVIRTADALAARLAELARNIRTAAETLMAHESENGRLRKLHKAFQTALIHDLKESDFADMYAQTITYGLLTAAISRQSGALVAEDVKEMVPVTNPFLKEMLETFLHAGGRKGGIDFDELGVQEVVEALRSEETDLPAILRDFNNRAEGEDPVIRFYEDFLEAYDKALKVQRGVFYTPKPVVSYIVRGVHELLQTEFGLEDGLASTVTWGEMARLHPEIRVPQGVSPDSFFVTILDPATGTATFLVEVIDVIYKTMSAKWKREGKNAAQIQAAWNEYVPQALLPRLYGYELMMAPYAIAHMKIGLKLFETGYRFASNQRANIYLTNALEEPSQLAEGSAASLFEALGHEAQAVNAVKRGVHFTVVIGNPPYSGHSANASKNDDGSWNFIGKLLQDYYKVDGKPLGERNPKWLQDDYVKFIRFGQWNIQRSQIGILAMITNHGYLDNPTFRGMRQQLMQTFSEIHVIDLHGNSNKKETDVDGSKDENVFDIQQGVSICFMTKDAKIKKPNIFHENLFGVRDYKYAWLSKSEKISGKEIYPVTPFYLFTPQNTELQSEYNAWMNISQLMPVNSVGIVTGQDGETISLNLDGAQKLARKHKISVQKVSPIVYRPFDTQYIVYDNKVVTRTRSDVMKHMTVGENIGLVSVRQVAEGIFNHTLVSDKMIESRLTVSNKGIGFIFPLYLYPDMLVTGQSNFLSEPSGKGQKGRRANFSEDFLRNIEQRIKLTFISDKTGDLRKTFGPEDIFHYMYAVFHSPTYRRRYAEFLKIDFPRLPLTSNVALFRQLCGLGKELVGLHLLESEELGNQVNRKGGVKFSAVRGQSSIVAKGYPKYEDGKVYINAEAHFAGVPEEVWEFHIGGYQVCEKWLKDRRGRELSAEDIEHYQKVVVALKETIRLMAEVDEAIESHGGWPIR